MDQFSALQIRLIITLKEAQILTAVGEAEF